jgi:ABC-2 type transport system ATP-binding protein
MKISAKDIVKKYAEKVAVSEVNLDIVPGKILGLLGPNGAGKSTTIKILSGQIKPTSGSVVVDGVEFEYLPEEFRKRIGIMPQEIIIWDDMTIMENLQMSAALFNLDTETTKKRIDFLVEALKLKPEINTLARNLSGGYRRRVNLAISVIHDPEVIFLDEPTPGIDAQSRLLLNEFIQSLADTGKYSIVLTDHYLEEAETLCDYFVIIDNGKVVTEGTLSQLKTKHGQGKFMEIELDEVTLDKISSVLLKEFPQGKFVKNTFICLANDLLGTLTKATKLIEEKGITIHNISVKEPSLEDIFLLITGRDLRE